MSVLKVFQKKKTNVLSKIYLTAFTEVRMLQNINRWIYATLDQKGQHSDFLSHCRLFRNAIIFFKKIQTHTEVTHCYPKTFTCRNKRNSDAKWYVKKNLLNT